MSALACPKRRAGNDRYNCRMQRESRLKDQERRKFLLRMAKRWSEFAAEKEREVLRAARSAV
jgi:hypothetical protein